MINTTIERLSEIKENYEGCLLAYGHFTVIHPGHIRYLRHCRDISERLVVAIMGDNQWGEDSRKRYKYNELERSESVALLGIADNIVVLSNEDLSEAIRVLRPSTVVLGTEYRVGRLGQNTLDALREVNSRLQFHAGETTSDSAYLLEETEDTLKTKKMELFRDTCKANQLDKDYLARLVDGLKDARLIVLGDTVVDQYTACEALGMSAEAPVIVVREQKSKNFVGAAGVVAAHIQNLGASCKFISVVGKDDTAEVVREWVKTSEIEAVLVTDDTRPTTFKKRYLVEQQKLFRVSRLEEGDISEDIENQIIESLERFAADADAIVISDFVYGVLTKRVLARVYELANKHGLLLFGDLQCSSQVGDIKKYGDFTLLCPNEKELRIAMQDTSSGLETLSRAFIEETRCKNLLLKLSAEGFIGYEHNSSGEIQSVAYPALSVNPLDVAGAGDAVLAVMACGLSSGLSMAEAGALGACMASLAVEQVGNGPISCIRLKERLLEVLNEVGPEWER